MAGQLPYHGERGGAVSVNVGEYNCLWCVEVKRQVITEVCFVGRYKQYIHMGAKTGVCGYADIEPRWRYTGESRPGYVGVSVCG